MSLCPNCAADGLKPSRITWWNVKLYRLGGSSLLSRWRGVYVGSMGKCHTVGLVPRLWRSRVIRNRDLMIAAVAAVWKEHAVFVSMYCSESPGSKMGSGLGINTAIVHLDSFSIWCGKTLNIRSNLRLVWRWKNWMGALWFLFIYFWNVPLPQRWREVLSCIRQGKTQQICGVLN